MKTWLVILGITFCSLASAQHVDFQVIGVTIAPEVKEQCLRHVKFQNEFYHEILGSWVVRDIKVLVIADTAVYTNYYQQVYGYPPQKGSVAFYWPKTDRMYIYYQDDDDLVTSFAHELSHVMFHGRCDRNERSFWLDEGMAQYFSYLRINELGEVRQTIQKDYSSLESMTLRKGQVQELINQGGSPGVYENMYIFGGALAEYIYEQYRDEVKLFYDHLCVEKRVTGALKKKLGRAYKEFIPGFQGYYPQNH